MANVTFKRGTNLSNLPIVDGQFIIKTDERGIYVDVGTERLRIGDFIGVANIAALPTAGASETALYYVEDINCLAKWNGTQWIQINKDSGAVNFTVTGDGNAITSVAYNAETRTLTLTKGVTFATPADVDGKISEKVGDLGTFNTVKAYVDDKTSGIATDASLSALTGRVTAAEGEIDDLQAAIAEGGSVTTAIASAKAAGDAAQADIDALETNVGTIPEGKTVIGLISEAKAQADKGLNKANAVYLDVSLIDAKIGDVAEDKTVVEMIADAKTAATYDDNAVRGLISDNTAAIADVKEDVDAFLNAAEVGEAAVDTLKEIQEYIAADGTAAATMTANIAANASAIAAEKTRAEGAEAALTTAVNAAQADADALDTRVTAVEGKAHEHANKALLDTYTQTEANLADAVTKKHEHANAEVLDGITAAKVTAWDGAQAGAEATAAAALDATKTELNTAINAKADAATTLAGYNIGDAYTKTETDGKISEALTWGTF